MTIMRLGLSMTGEPLFQSMEEEAMGQTLATALGDNADSVRSLTQITAHAVSYKGEVERTVLDPGDPRVAVWTYLVNSTDPRRADYAGLLDPLARHRGMPDPVEPLLYNGEPEDEWFDWLSDNSFALSLEEKMVPGYVLIAGGPEQVPFRFQSILDTVANVGRIDLPPNGLKQYVDKLIRLENAPELPAS